MDASDADLVRRCVAGEAGAWEGFDLRFREGISRAVRRTLLRFGGRGAADLADDMVQEVMLHLMADGARALGAVPPAYDLRPWIAMIASRRCIDRMRRERVRREGAREGMDRAVQVEPARGSAAWAVDDEAVREAFGRLSPRDRTILRLRVMEEMSYRRIGELMGMPVGTVGTLLLRARKALAESLRRGSVS